MPSRSIHILAAAIAAVLSWSIPADAAVVAGPALPGPGLCLATGLEYGAPPATGTLGVAGESDCWRLIASAGDRVRVRVVGTSGGLAPRIEIAGCTTSPVAEATCALGGGGHSVLVRAAAAGQTVAMRSRSSGSTTPSAARR